MSQKINEAKNDADKFASMVLHYSQNAEKNLKEGNFHKAGEMMWGSMSCALKAVAAKKDVKIRSHKDIGKFAIRLSRDEENKQIFHSYTSASMLHHNFYESDLDEYMIRSIIQEVSKTIGMLMKNIGYRAP